MTDTSSSAPDGATVPEHRTARGVILDGIRAAILSGELEPGSRIGQEDVAARFGVSRLPVREALRELESEGLITLVPHSGARVARVDFDEFVEIYRLREAIEPIVLEDSAARLSDEQIAEIRALALAIEDSAEDSAHWLALDRQFHLAAYRATTMRRGMAMIEQLWNQTQHFRRAHIIDMTADQLEVVHMEHLLIVDALERRDPADAADRGRAHIRRTRTDLVARRAAMAEAEPTPRRRRRAKPTE